MALEEQLPEDLGRRLIKTDCGNLIVGFDKASEKGMLWELLQNQLVIMQVLAAMNGMDPNTKAYKHLLD